LTIDAFNLADKNQTPVFIMADKYLLEGRQSTEKSKIKNQKSKIDRGKLLTQEELLKITNYKRYQITDDGISPRAIPGMKGSLHQVNSYEHLEDGHTTEEAAERTKQVEKRNRKTETFLREDARLPILFGKKEAPLTLVSWGSMKGPILQAMKEGGEKFNYLHFSYLWPLPKERLTKVLSGLKKTLLVENNSTAQLGQLLMMVTGIDIKEKLLKYSGRPIYPEEVLEKVSTMIK
jgi:2-oxoglutarate ferredoxin oxidoreductase subunit alpha